MLHGQPRNYKYIERTRTIHFDKPLITEDVLKKLAEFFTNGYLLEDIRLRAREVKYSTSCLHASATRIVVLCTLMTSPLPSTNTLIAFSAVILIGEVVKHDFVGI